MKWIPGFSLVENTGEAERSGGETLPNKGLLGQWDRLKNPRREERGGAGSEDEGWGSG